MCVSKWITRIDKIVSKYVLFAQLTEICRFNTAGTLCGVHKTTKTKSTNDLLINVRQDDTKQQNS